MAEFKREERYLVVKLKDIDSEKESALRAMQLPLTDCVVVESDWPEYDTVWEMIESRVTGKRKTTELSKLLVEPCDGDERENCELECGAFGTYCKCKFEQIPKEDK